MSKKSFSGGLDALLSPSIIEEEEPILEKKESKPNKRGRPKTAFKEISSTTQLGTLEGEARFTCILKEEHIDKIKALAYWERMQIKELFHDMLEHYFSQKGTKHLNQALTAYEQSRKKKP